jgi:hypothetical protein
LSVSFSKLLGTIPVSTPVLACLRSIMTPTSECKY